MTSSRQTMWKSRAVVAALLAVGVVASCLLIGKMQERKPFVSKVVAGYRYRCTLATDWEHLPDSTEEYIFTPSAPSPIREWIAIHLLNQPPTPRITHGSLPQLILATTTEVKIKAGYPEAVFPHSGVSAKHFRIDGCPATETVVELPVRGLTLHYHILLVCTPDYKNTYAAGTIAERNKSDLAEHEIQAIIASFHVEKVAASGGGKP